MTTRNGFLRQMLSRFRKCYPQVGGRADRRRPSNHIAPLEALEERLLLTHFRYGNLSWEPDAQANTIDFRFQQAWRLSFFSSDISKVGDVTIKAGEQNQILNYGDGGSDKIALKAISINSAEDYFFAEAGTSPDGGKTFVPGFKHTYSKAGDITAYLEAIGSARIDTLQNNPGGGFRIETLVNVGSGNASPVSALPPVIQVVDNTVTSFQIPAIDPNGDALNYRLSTSAEACSFGFVQPTGFSISPSGLVTWDIRDTGGTATKPGDLWTSQVMVEDLDSTGAVKSKVPLDFVLQVTASNNPPVVTTNPAGPFFAVVGQPLTFTVTATDADKNDSVVTLQPLNPPEGMTFAPNPVTPGNPVSITVSWTPTAAQIAKNFVLVFQATDNHGGTGINSVIATVIPLTQLSINNVAITEGTGDTKNAVLTVTLSPASIVPVTVDFATADGSAIAGEDFVTNTGTLMFAPGQLAQTITVEIIGDALFENPEDFFVNLSGATNAMIKVGQGKGIIYDNDVVTSKVSIDDVVVTEGTGSVVNAVFTVSLSAASGAPVTVKYATGNSTAISPDDYTAGSGIVTFAAGETSQTITVPVIGDSSYEGSQAFFVNLSSATNASIADTQGKCTILDDDLPPGLSVSDVIVTEQTGSVVTAVFIVSLSEPSTLPVKVNYATSNGTAFANDYLAKRGTLLFSPGQVSKTLSISVLGDTRDELDEAFFMNLSVPYNAIITVGQGQCTITDDDATPKLTIDNMTVTEGSGTTVKATFTVHLSAISGLPVTVNYATEDNTAIASADYTITNNSLTFLPGQTSKTVSVPITGDALDEPNETFFVNLSGPNYATLANSRALGTITDNDAAPKLSINNLTVTEGNSGTVDLVFTVKLSAASGQVVTVDFATRDVSAVNGVGGDYTSNTGSLRFDPGETIKTITVSILGDSIHEQLNKSFSLDLSNALNALFANSKGIGTILDND